jgi:hypothetical protein
VIHTLIAASVWTVLTLGCAYLAWEMVRAARRPEGEHAFPDRWSIASRAAFVVLATAYALIAVGWQDVPAALWWVNVGAAATALAAGAARWQALPWGASDAGARGRRRTALLASGLTVAVVLFLSL